MESDYRTLSEIESLISTDPEFPLFNVMRANYYARKSLKEKVRDLEIKQLPNHSRLSLSTETRRKIHLLTEPAGDQELQQDYIANHYVLRDLKIALDGLESAENFQSDLSKTGLTETLKSEPSNSLEFFVRAGHIERLFGPAAVDHVLKDCNQAIALNSHNFLALQLLAHTYRVHKIEYHLAIMYYEQVLMIFPKYFRALSGRAASYYMLEEYRNVIKDINSVLEITNEINTNTGLQITEKGKRGLYNDYLVRASSYHMLDEIPKAIECYTEMIELYPKLNPAFAVRGAIYVELGKLDLALKDLNTALSIKSDTVYALISRGMVYYFQGEVMLALKDLSKVMELTKENEHIDKYRYRGMVYLELERFEDAIIDLSNGVKFGDVRSLECRQVVVQNLKEKIMKM